MFPASCAHIGSSDLQHHKSVQLAEILALSLSDGEYHAFMAVALTRVGLFVPVKSLFEIPRLDLSGVSREIFLV